MKQKSEADFRDLRYVDNIPRKDKLLRLLWDFVWVVFFRPTPRWALHEWRGFLLRLFGAKIGNGCRIAPTCRIWAPWNLTLGHYCALAADVDCYSMDKIEIGCKVAVSQRAFLCSGSHAITDLRRPLITKPIKIGDHVWICAEAFIGPGVVIGDGAVVAARSAVFKNVEEWHVVGGNPAAVIKKREII